MTKLSIDPFHDLADVALGSTSILGSKDKDKTNIMALDWRTIGNLWGDPVCVVAVAPSRYTFELLNKHPEFVLNVPSPAITSVVSVAGGSSGRNTDKAKKAGVTIVPGKSVDVGVIDEAWINYECKIIHTAESGSCSHRLFFGEILEAYADEKLLK